jgi:hypothetical protein
MSSAAAGDAKRKRGAPAPDREQRQARRDWLARAAREPQH